MTHTTSISSDTQYFQYTRPFQLESGEILPGFQLAYHTYGQLAPQRDNVIWVCHALTANAEVSDWWEGLYGEGKILDPTRYFIVCANMLGSCYGSTNGLSINPLSQKPFYHSFPLLTNRDMVQAFDLLRQSLGISAIYLGLGGSMGGQHLLEWAIMKPEIFEHLFLVATNAQHSSWGIAFNEAQRMAIEADATWLTPSPTAGLQGMKAARAIALLSYRNYHTYFTTQHEAQPEKFDQFKAASYQQYQGEKLVNRFHTFAYWTLSKAMDSHHVGRGRGSVEQALARIRAKTLVMGISSDLLFPVSEQQFLADHIPEASYIEITSAYGHDGFLIEHQAITAEIHTFLKQPVSSQNIL